uniref:Origin recognition complex subunit 5 n=1 Tax=Glossina brevipalpis TaxID=37001 RepID=A0A1A9WXE0_9MUSC
MNTGREEEELTPAEIIKVLNEMYPCRSDFIENLTALLLNIKESLPRALYIYGHSGTGKTVILKELLRLTKKSIAIKTSYVNCIECYTTKILLENILEDLCDNEDTDIHCENLKEFIELLKRFYAKLRQTNLIIVLDQAERIRDMDANMLPSLMRLQELAGLNVCVVLVGQISFEKYYAQNGLTDIITLHCCQYTKSEVLLILSNHFEVARNNLRRYITTQQLDKNDTKAKLHIVEKITMEFFNNYLNILLCVFYKACRDLPELKNTADVCFISYMKPVFNQEVDVTDAQKLWRNITPTLRTALTQIYMPSHNSAKEDKRLFVKHHGKKRNRLQNINAKAKVFEKRSTAIGPKTFTIDRLLAIFYAILDEKVGLTCNLLSQISTLVQLKLLSFVSGENNVMDGAARLQCTVGLEFVVFIGKVVGFNVRQYLCDFM